MVTTYSPLDIPQVKNWLNQFDTADKYLAVRLLQFIKFVSFEKFEEFIQNSSVSLLDDILKTTRDKKCVPFFTVVKATDTVHNSEKEKKLAKDSAGRIGHALTNLERQIPRRVQVNPRKASMVKSQVSNIVYVDDFIGSGDRFRNFWRDSVPGYIKSWASRGWCKVWVIAYAAHSRGIKNIVKNIGCLEESSFVTKYTIEKSNILEIDNLKNMLEIYAGRTNKPRVSLGYGKIAVPMVFQHGCPNNAPAILWASGKKNPKGCISSHKRRWEALFPERGVPTELYPLFNLDTKIDGLPELLWTTGQYRMAVSFLERIDFPKKAPETLITLTILALLSSRKNQNIIRNILMMTTLEFDLEFKKLVKFQLCNSEGQVTNFGKDVLERSKRVHPDILLEKQIELFYPSAFMGVQREV